MMSTSDSPIAILDSGIGGLPYLAGLREMLPAEHFWYLADTAGFPYGTRDAGELAAHLSRLVSRVIEVADPKAVVIACNTASVVALKTLRATFDLPFVGVVPAVKPAGSLSRNRRIGLLATNRTVLDSYTDDLIDNFASDCFIERIGDGDIVEFVEKRFLDSDETGAREAVRHVAERFGKAKIDTVVLGCTHFVFIRKALESLLPSGTMIIDSREGVAMQTSRVIGAVRSEKETSKRSMVYITGGVEEERYRRFAEHFDCGYGGVFG